MPIFGGIWKEDGLEITTFTQLHLPTKSHRNFWSVTKAKPIASIIENFWAGGVKQPLNSSRHPSSRTDISSIPWSRTDSGHGRTVATDGQWPRTVAKKKVVLVHSYGPQNNDKVKEPANEGIVLSRKPSARQGCWNERNWRFFCSCWVVKNRNRKVKELEWEMWRTGRGGSG
jgi:hypothetical protein